MKRLLLMCAALCMTSCGDPLTQIVLTINSDIEPSDLGQLLITVRGPDTRLGVDYTADFSDPATAPEFPITLGLLLSEDASGDTVLVRVVSNNVNGTEMLEASAETNFVFGSTRDLDLFLNSSCIGIPCDSTQTCGVDGLCTSNQIEGDTLPEHTD